MKKILQDLMEGKYAIGYTLNTLANMVPHKVSWLNKLPIFDELIATVQVLWFITKIFFFVLVLSWFKPQYNHIGAKIILVLLSFGMPFFAWRMTKRENIKRKGLA